MQSHLYRFSFRLPGRIFGILIVFFALALFSVELGHLYAGSVNRGRNGSAYSLYSPVLWALSPVNERAIRRSWPFLITSLVSGCLLIFLIAGWRSIYTPGVDRDLAIVCLTKSSLLLLLFAAVLLCTRRSIDVCTRKHFSPLTD